MIRVGTCGFQKSRREHFRRLDCVEVQQTFYDPPDDSTLLRWRSEAPEGFEFTVKAWMLVSHGYNRRLWSRIKRPVKGPPEAYGGLQLTDQVLWAWSETLRAARALGASIIVIQTPPSFGPSEGNVARVERFFGEVERGGFKVAWEPRGGWWDKPGLLERVQKDLEVYIAGDVLRGRMPPSSQELLYARLHGLGGREVNYKYRYKDEDLRKLLDLCEGERYKARYVLFNNVYAYEDASRFRELVDSLRGLPGVRGG